MDIMVDLETMGAGPKAAVASIGAVAFDPHGDDDPAKIPEERKFYVVLDMRDQVKLGREFDPDTIYWWLTQDRAAQSTLTKNQIPTIAGLTKYADWLYGHRDPLKLDQVVWCLGATFDHVILTSMFQAIGRKSPTHYGAQLCFRTIAKFSGVSRPILRDNMAHNALDDAIKQAIWMQQCVRKMRSVSFELDGRRIAEVVAGDLPTELRLTEERTNVEGPEASSK